MARNKVIYNGQTLIDLTADTIEESDVINNKSFHKRNGEIATGTCTYDADTSDANAAASEILASKTAYVNGQKVTGTMPNRGEVDTKITDRNDVVTIAQGYHDGSGTVEIDPVERAKIIASNIKNGVEILGIVGEYTGEGSTSQAKTVTPTASQQVVLPDSGIDYLSQVTVNAIPYSETLNEQGGYTVTIATVA